MSEVIAEEPDSYTCEDCGGTFDKERTDEEAWIESAEIWGYLDPAEAAVVCDDCFEALMRRVPSDS